MGSKAKHMEELELARAEVERVLKEYQEQDVCWNEFAESVHLDSRLGLDMQVQVYGELCRLIDGDMVCRIIPDEEGREYEEEIQYNLIGFIEPKYYREG